MKMSQMRERIEICVPDKTTGYIVNQDPTVSPLCEIWAKREDKIQEERFSAKAVNAVRKKQFIVRYRDDIDETMFVKYKNEILSVLGAAPLDNKNQWLVILVGKVVANEY